MGQRHQVYLRTKEKFYNQGNPNNQKPKTLGIHHQWLYGHTAIRLLHNFLMFASKDLAETYPRLVDQASAMEVFKSAYSFDHTTAYFHGVIDITNESTDDPRNGDNNNGITVIDFEDGKLKYCFLSIGHLECMHNSVQQPDEDNEDEEDTTPKTLTYKNFEPIDVNHWMNLHYGVGWNEGDTESLEIQKLIDFVNNFEVLSVERLAEIFPKMVSNDREKGLYLVPNSIDFILDKKKKKKKSQISKMA